MKKLFILSLFLTAPLVRADEATDRKIAQLEERVAKLEKLVESLTNKKEAPTSPAKAKNKFGIPDDVYAKIKAKAAEDWPDSFSMQTSVIEMQAKAYKELHD